MKIISTKIHKLRLHEILNFNINLNKLIKSKRTFSIKENYLTKVKNFRLKHK